MKKYLISILTALLIASSAIAQSIDPDDTQKARKSLEMLRQKTLAADHVTVNVTTIHRMLDLGLWQDAFTAFSAVDSENAEVKLARARYEILNNDFSAAEALVESVLLSAPEHRQGRLLRAKLFVEAWELAKARGLCDSLLAENTNDEEVALLIGRIFLLEKDFETALEWAKRVQSLNEKSAEAWLLESDVHFWNRKPELAEAPLRKCLELNPFHADARFNYGYAIWRRVDATLLDAMAAQWEIALAVNPLNYLTHWHWGNGHTNLTYADYIHPTDDEVREKLKEADSLVAVNQIPAAIEFTRGVDREFSESVLPALYRGSYFYMAYDMDRAVRLDSAQNVFESILAEKNHYGPAHNGLAAVIKQKRMGYLAVFDSLQAEIANAEIDDHDNFVSIFPDVLKYPGDRVKNMVWNSLFAARAYFPMLSKMNRKYTIPPLHIDLAIAMNRNFFRQATTFDNRQWMDIRGVGSGSSGIEYVERGVHQERNVVLHEYVHLFHGRVFTDQESRRVRQLYYNAMEKNLVLDYYAANNESEYLAQVYPAFFIPVKVHPLNHKSMNTRSDLMKKDPEAFAFTDSLVAKQRAFLNGNEQALASNWAQVYLNLAQQATMRAVNDSTAKLAAALLDTALTWNENYLPAILGYANLRTREKNFVHAEKWLEKAVNLNARYAPTYTGYADFYAAQAELDKKKRDGFIEKQEEALKKAFDLETDFSVRARMNRRLREFYAWQGDVPSAIRAAESYVQDAPTVSTYLRDRRDEALAYAAWQKGKLGYIDDALAGIEPIVKMKPQNYPLRGQHAEVLIAAGKYDEAIENLEELQRILSAARAPSPQFMIMIAEAHLGKGDASTARQAVQPILDNERRARNVDPLWLARVYAEIGEIEKAEKLLGSAQEVAKTPGQRADWSFTEGVVLNAKGETKQALKSLESAIENNPYHFQATLLAVKLTMNAGKAKKARKLGEAVQKLEMQPGEVMQEKMSALLADKSSE